VKSWVWLDTHEVIALHRRLLADHGGAHGLRDAGLLDSALHRAHQLDQYGTPDVFDLAATLTSGIVRNHPFIDGNKRVGFIVGVLFLELNGHRFNATQQDATRAVIALAAGACNEAEYRAFLAANSAQREPSR